MSYQDFIASKRRKLQPMGFTPGPLNGNLFDWQSTVVDWAVRRGRAALFEECGLGKTLQQLAWAEQVVKHTNKPVVLHCPVGVRQQTKREAEKFGIDCEVKVVNESSGVIVGINLVNYEKLHHFDPSVFAGVVLDECFAFGTTVDTPSGQCYIQDLRPGMEIINASGVDVISDVHKREVKYAVKVRCGGTETIASPNHPWFTQRGWVASKELEPGDSILQAKEAVRILREDVSPSAISSEWDGAFLREILLSEMADEATATSCESTHCGGGEEASGSEIEMVSKWIGSREKGAGESCGYESNVESRSAEKGIWNIESNEAPTFRAWRKRDWNDSSTSCVAGCTREWVGSRVERIVGETQGRLPIALQARLRSLRNEDWDRGRWSLAQKQEGSGREEGRDAIFVRVDGIEILEPGHHELDRLRDADGKLYFYDLGATRHPSYSVNGLLVHNSSVLKNYTGKTKRLLVDSYARTPYRLACTATPSPNDQKELGNHAEFLGIMPSNEMLSRWFINDTMKAGGYRLKKHGQDDYWRWVASWAVCLSKPSDIGGSDDGYALPELAIERHIVEVEQSEAPAGMLFNTAGISATTIHEEKRLTCTARAKRSAELVADKNRVAVVWCDTDYEADALIERIDDAIEIRGSHPEKRKEEMLLAFEKGEARCLITKPTVAGFGLNWQHCDHQVFAGLSYSFEQYYQAVRRCWRFGQRNSVNVDIVLADSDSAIESAIASKEADHNLMQSGMAKAMKSATLAELGIELEREDYQPTKKMEIPKWLKS